MRPKKAFTAIELVIVIVIVALIATGLVKLFAPMVNFYFYMPVSNRVNMAALDLLDVIFEGDHRAEGLRYAGPPCTIPTGGSSTITAASASSLTYRYTNTSTCHSTQATGSNAEVDVTIAYDSGTSTVTRSIEGGSATAIPYYATSASGIKFNPPSGVNFFTYYDAAGTDLGATPVVTSIYRVDVNVIATTGSGEVRHYAGQIRLKSGVEIKRYTT